ncbi:MAG: hypothetical protein P8X51_14660 [Maritimibacter sp.]
MSNPFQKRVPSLNGPALDILPITPADGTDLSSVAIALYIESGGPLSILTANDQTRSVTMADFSYLPVGGKRVNATGTTATGIHALMVG